MKKLSVAESFYSIQGEGKTIGYPAVFLRLAGCNLICGGQGTQFDKKLHNNATWRCDSIEVWMKGKAKSIDNILNEECIEALKNGANLIITGGEPCMQQDALIDFFLWLENNVAKDIYIECETNGTISPNKIKHKINQFNCSPKLENSGNIKEIRINTEVLKEINQHQGSIFKFVISNKSDWKEIERDFLQYIDRDKIWLMPAGESQKELKETKKIVAEICKENYLKYTGRLQVEIWNKKTGV